MTATATCVLPANDTYDPRLDARVRSDVVRYRFKRSLFAALSVLIIMGELLLGVGILLLHVRNPHGTEALALSSVSAFLITVDVAFGIRERASAHHATLNRLLGIRNQMRYPDTSPLWSEYSSIRAYSKINYLEAVFDSCSWSLPDPIEAPTGVAPPPLPTHL